MQFDWWTFGFQLVNLAVLLWLLGHFLFRPVARIVAERKAETERVLREAEDQRSAATQAEKAAREARERIAAERSEILEKARREADEQKQAILDEARKEASGIVKKANNAGEQILAEERKQLKRQAGRLAVTIANRLLDELPGEARLAGYPQRLAKAVSELAEEDKAAILSDRASLHLESPRPLTDSETAAAQGAVAALLEEDTHLPVEVDASLIAGLELRSRSGAIRNSLAADLDRVADRLDDDHV